ncbi:MAG: hypothetical protein WD377_08535 [Nitriliruptoraceae bacterium]
MGADDRAGTAMNSLEERLASLEDRVEDLAARQHQLEVFLRIVAGAAEPIISSDDDTH